MSLATLNFSSKFVRIFRIQVSLKVLMGIGIKLRLNRILDCVADLKNQVELHLTWRTTLLYANKST